MSRLRIDPADLVAIAVGGVLGALLRERITNPRIEAGWFAYAPNTAVTVSYEPSIATRILVINAAGCLLLGALTVLLARAQSSTSRRALVALSTGFCGSLTTFSSFAVQVAQRLRGEVLVGGPDLFDAPAGFSYLVLSVAAGALAFAVGRVFVKQVVAR